MTNSRNNPSHKWLLNLAALACVLSGTAANALHTKPIVHQAPFDITPYYGEHVAQCSGAGVSDPRDQEKTFIIKPGEIEIRGHNFWYSKLKSTSKGTPRSTAYYFVSSYSNTTLVFENDKLTSATTKDVAPDLHGQAMAVETDCVFN